MTVSAIRYLTIFAFALLIGSDAIAQHSTAGKNFWVAFPQNARFEIGMLKQLIVVTALEDANVALTRPAIWKPGAGISMGRSLKKGETYTFEMDTSVQCIKSEEVEGKGIHVGSTGKVIVTAYSMRKASSDSYRVMPVEALGREYVAVGYAAPKADPTFTTEFTVLATEDNTTLDIALTGATKTGTPPEEAISVKLDRGQTYNVKGGYVPGLRGDLTGSRIKASSPVAVFTGHTCAQVPDYTNFCDVLIEQAAPIEATGREFILPKMTDKIAYAFRVVATQPSTIVRFGDSTAALNVGEFKDFLFIEGDRHLTADKPVIVAQYGTSFDADVNKVGDPFMSLVPPIDRYATSNVVTTPPIRGDWHHYLAIVCETDALKDLQVNGDDADLRKTSRVNDRFSVVHIELGQGLHEITANGKLATFSYGFGRGNDNFDSYGTYCGPW